jgi:putative transcriptional regulator
MLEREKRIMTPNELKQLRHKLGKTQQEMADLIGVSVSGYRKWEQGQREVKGAALKTLENLKRD